MTRQSGPRRGLRTVAVATGLATLGALVAPAAVASPESNDAATWLVSQLTDGDHVEGDWGPSYGQTADVAYALLADGSQPDALADTLAYLTTEEAVGSYAHGAGFDADDAAYVGAVAKLGLLTSVAGLDSRDIAGEDLVATLEGLESETGRFEDRSDYGNYANIFGQAFGVLFLTSVADATPSEAAVQALLDAQCDDGGFPTSFDADPCVGGPDSTGVALQALVAADDVVDTDAAAFAAATFLVDGADDDGAYGDPQNTNSTGYAGMALDSVSVDVSASVAFLLGIQNDDGGLPINPGGDSDVFATAQALPLLAGESFLELIRGTSVRDPKGVTRVAGDTRVNTAIGISQATFGDGDADTVVLSRSDDFADALAGTPVAAAANGPLLLTPTADLDGDVLAEVARVLPAGGTVHLLGGEAALSADVATALTDAGFEVVRLSGDDRYETSVAIADFLGNPDLLLVTTGLDFPDAMAAGAVAVANGGAVLLTAGDQKRDATTTYLGAHASAEVVTIGGPASRAYPAYEAIVGAGRAHTAIGVAERFFTAPAAIGVARSDVFADALAGGVQVGRLGGPLLLTSSDALPAVTGTYVCQIRESVDAALLWGGVNAIGDAVVTEVSERLDGSAC